MAEPLKYSALPGDDARDVPVRLLVVQEDKRPPVDGSTEPMVMTFPHLVVREVLAFLALFLFLSILSIVFDAPLEELANPQKTPNPAKAPWYFLGLQELLHFYSPLWSGVVLPGVVVGALVVIPYFDINLTREPFYRTNASAKLLGVWATIAALTVFLVVTPAHTLWAVMVPLWVIGLLMTIPAFDPTATRGVTGWLARRSLPFWIFTWFLAVTVILTAIGTFFRGPGWDYVLPWRDGMF